MPKRDAEPDLPVKVICGDNRKELYKVPVKSVDAVVTDPPYGLVEPRSGMSGFRPRTEAQKAARKRGFMGKEWDHGVPDQELWCAVLRCMKPGAYLLTFGGTRTYHRMACAVEDAGFEIRDCLMWLYGTGFPKGQGCLKPAWEPILLARRPGQDILPLGIDGCRIPAEERKSVSGFANRNLIKRRAQANDRPWMIEADPDASGAVQPHPAGRYPANVVHDGSEEVLEAFAAFGEKKAGTVHGRYASAGQVYGGGNGLRSQPKGDELITYGDSGTAARFFYCAKASKSERGKDNNHPTVKPLALMRWLVKLVCPPGGVVLDPFAGSGTTGLAALEEGRQAVLIEQQPEYVEIIKRRLQER